LRADAGHDRPMVGLLMLVLRGLALALRGHRELVLENVALRQQLQGAAASTGYLQSHWEFATDREILTAEGSPWQTTRKT
jgi:hypothetical protein